jgi:tRNA G37 N-methylase TrmD
MNHPYFKEMDQDASLMVAALSGKVAAKYPKRREWGFDLTGKVDDTDMKGGSSTVSAIPKSDERVVKKVRNN